MNLVTYLKYKLNMPKRLWDKEIDYRLIYLTVLIVRIFSNIKLIDRIMQDRLCSKVTDKQK